MHDRAIELLKFALFATLPVLAAPVRAAPAAWSVYAEGRVRGAWELGLGPDGAVRGVLFADASGAAAYRLTGDLVNVPSACLSCSMGAITGTLDDGIGTGPDFIVRGQFFGGLSSATGRFEARIFDLSGYRLKGRIYGAYSDDPLDEQAGRMLARWRILVDG